MSFSQLPSVLAQLSAVGERFASAGHQAFLVGGIVRDLALERPLRDELDFDLSTGARPDEVKEILASIAEVVWPLGERFGTIAARVDGRVYEVTTFRSEVYVADSRKPVVAFADDVTTDLARRDFTVNAMAVDIATGDVADPFDGMGDLAAQRLRTPLGATISFQEDPLRMLRAARFVAGYDLRPDHDVVVAMADMASRLAIISAERIRDELDKLLAVPDPSSGLELLATSGLLARFLPEATADARVMVTSLDADPVLRLAALVVSQPPVVARRRLDTLKHSRQRAAFTARLVGAVRALARDPRTSDEAVRRWVRDVGAGAEHALALAARYVGGEVADAVATRMAVLHDDLSALDVPLDGEAVMALLDIRSGPLVGEAMDQLWEWRLAEGPLTEPAARARLAAWWAERT